MLFRAVCTAAAKLPDMELHTELMSVTNSDDGLTVVFDRKSAQSGDHRIFNGFHDDFDNFNDLEDYEEEGMLYYGD